MNKINQLPHWIVADTLPAFYETEGATAIQMVAKLYNQVNDLITAYNSLIDTYTQFENDVNDELADMNDDMSQMRTDIDEAIDYMKTHLVETLTQLFQQAIDDGLIQVGLITDYDETDESLDLSVGLIPDGNEVEF